MQHLYFLCVCHSVRCSGGVRQQALQKRTENPTFHAIIKTASEEGVLALMKGLGPTVARQVPLNLVRFMTVEQLRKIF